jgi:hypothetical protein
LRHRAVEDRRRLEAENASLRRRVDEIERALAEAMGAHAATVDELKDGLAGITRELARERAVRRMAETRRARPLGQRVAAEAARQAVERARGSRIWVRGCVSGGR